MWCFQKSRGCVQGGHRLEGHRTEHTPYGDSVAKAFPGSCGKRQGGTKGGGGEEVDKEGWGGLRSRFNKPKHRHVPKARAQRPAQQDTEQNIWAWRRRKLKRGVNDVLCLAGFRRREA